MRSATTIQLEDNGSDRPIFAERRARDAVERSRTRVVHDFAAVAFYVGGNSRVEQRGIWFLQRGDALIVPSGEPHRVIDAHQPDFWRLGFCAHCFASEMPTSVFEVFERVRNGASPVVPIPDDRWPFLEALFNELSRHSHGSDEALVRRSLLALILAEVTRAGNWSSAAGSRGGVVAETLAFIERHCLEPLTLRQVAAAMKRTPSYITTALTRATGRSAVAWIIAGRMAEARRRLLHSDESVETIAGRVGYADPTHFVRMFRRAHGVTPAVWRAQRNAAHASAPAVANSKVRS